MASLPPVEVHRHPAGNGVEPRRRVAVGVEPGCCPPRLQERLLHRLLGEATVAQRLEGDHEHGAAVPVVQQSDRLRVAPPEAPEEPLSFHLALLYGGARRSVRAGRAA